MIPAGRVHAIGGGILLAEIQQSSDITYRLYDYGRKDKDGNPRQLHHDEAFEALNFNDVNPEAISYMQKSGHPVNIVTDTRFIVNFWRLSDEVLRDYSDLDSFIIYVVLSGKARITAGSETRVIKKGDTVLIEAACRNLKISPEEDFEALETFIK